MQNKTSPKVDAELVEVSLHSKPTHIACVPSNPTEESTLTQLVERPPSAQVLPVEIVVTDAALWVREPIWNII